MQKRLTNVRYCADRTVRIANQFLALAKSKNRSALEQNIEKFDICEIVRQLVAELAQSHDQVTFEMSGDECIPVQADMFSIEVIIRNLLDNAVWYGRPASDETQVVKIWCKKQSDEIILCVEDNGPSLTAEQMAHATKEFYRVNTTQVAPSLNSKAIKPDGAGLGLSIVRAMTDLHNGIITFSDSDHLGGLKFAFNCLTSQETSILRIITSQSDKSTGLPKMYLPFKQ